MRTESNGRGRLTRRRVLKAGAAALGGGAAVLAAAPPAFDAQAAQAPAVLTGTQTGRTFRGLVHHGTTLDVQQMRLLPIDPRQVVIRSTAVAPCYTIVRGALGTNAVRRAEVPNHCGFGVVEAVGAMVKRVQVGDRVVVAGTSQCGQCYQCLHGRPDYCQFTFFSNARRRRALRAVCAVTRRHARVRAGWHRRNERSHDGLRGVLRAGLHRLAGRAADAARRSAGLGLCRRPCRYALPAGIRCRRLRRRPGGLGAVQAGRVMGAGQVIVSIRSVPSRLRDEARRDDDARSRCGGRRHRRAHPRAVPGSERPALRAAASVAGAPAMP